MQVVSPCLEYKLQTPAHQTKQLGDGKKQKKAFIQWFSMPQQKQARAMVDDKVAARYILFLEEFLPAIERVV